MIFISIDSFCLTLFLHTWSPTVCTFCVCFFHLTLHLWVSSMMCVEVNENSSFHCCIIFCCLYIPWILFVKMVVDICFFSSLRLLQRALLDLLANILSRTFILCSWERLTCDFPFLWCSCQLLVSQLYWSHKIVWNILCFSVLWEILYRVRVFPVVFGRIHQRRHLVWSFPCRKV